MARYSEIVPSYFYVTEMSVAEMSLAEMSVAEMSYIRYNITTQNGVLGHNLLRTREICNR